MAATSEQTGSSISRKFRWLTIGIVLVAGLYSAGWYVVASKIETWLTDFLASPQAEGAQCPGLEVGGYPFLIGFTCKSTDITDPQGGASLTAGALRAVARIYSPGSALFELDGPAKLDLPDGSALEGQWRHARAMINAGFSGLNSASTTGEDLSLDLSLAQLPVSVKIKASHGEFHARRVGEDLQAATMIRDLDVGVDGQASPIAPVSSSMEFTLDSKADLLRGRPLTSKAMTGTITSFKIEVPGGLYGELNGPFEIDDEGYMSGTFKTRFDGLTQWEKNLLVLFPDAKGTISGMVALLKGLAKGGDAVTVNLVVDRGTITLSMFPIGHIPPI